MLLSSSPPPLCFGSLVNLVPNIEWKRGTRLFFNSNWTGIPWNRLKKTIHLLEAGLLALLVLLIQKIYLLAPMPALLKKKQTMYVRRGWGKNINGQFSLVHWSLKYFLWTCFVIWCHTESLISYFLAWLVPFFAVHIHQFRHLVYYSTHSYDSPTKLTGFDR